MNTDWLCIVPIVSTVLLTLLLNNVVKSLLISIVIGLLLTSTTSTVDSLFFGIDLLFTKYTPAILFEFDHLAILLFSFFITAMVHIGLKNGTLNQMVNKILPFATTKKRTMLSAYLMGILIFFDDYTNSLLVGGSMKKIFKKHKISVEKLAYIVDSTAAPVASISLISTWIGFELGEIKKCLPALSNYENIPTSAYEIFLNSIPYSFYPILTLAFILYLIWSGRDFGPMLQFEQKAQQVSKSEQLEQVPENDTTTESNWIGSIPIVSFVLMTIVGLFWSGSNNTLQSDVNWTLFEKSSTYLGNSDATKVILGSSILSLCFAVILNILLKNSVQKTGQWIFQSFQKISGTLSVLLLAWVLSMISKDLGLNDFLSNLVVNSPFPPTLFPATVFIAAALISFSTGSSWSAMGILYPIVVPISAALAFGNLQPMNEAIFYCSVASVLAGSVWGDHCSPISDTTILTSLSTDCLHLNHVQSQLPYALFIGIVSTVVGIIPSSYGLNTLLSFTLCTIVTVLIFNSLSKKTQVVNR